jgi:hypothetical protein
LGLLVLSAGCAHKKKKAPPPLQGNFSTLPGNSQTSTDSTISSTQSLVATPENSLTGKVVSVNETARFVVLSFPVGRLPAADQRFSVYRRGLKVGEIKITSQQLNEYIVADILEGDAEAGDEVRNR